MTPLYHIAAVDKLIELALEEDIGAGDITTDHLVTRGTRAKGVIVAKEAIVVAGLEVAQRIFQRLDAQVEFTAETADGDTLDQGQILVTVKGQLGPLLIAERTALNFLQRLSGIATHVSRYVAAVKGEPVRLLDTRKTTPGWRVLEKYAVRVGGACNHRMGLYDGVLIKDNHIAACGGITAAVKKIKANVSHLVKIEVETADMNQVREALDCGADVIMLDNMNLEQIRSAVDIIQGRALVEVSGNVTLEKLKILAGTGVDLISIGALTHAARSVDLSMRIEAIS